MATMESLIGLVNKIQRACTVLGDHGGEGLSLWEALPTVAVVGGQVICFNFLKFSLLFFSNIDWCVRNLIINCIFIGYIVESNLKYLNEIIEFWKIIGVGKCCRKRFSSSWIWYCFDFDYDSYWYCMFKVIWFVSFVTYLRCLFFLLSKGLSHGDL